jgi:hypothetical protein
VVVKVSKIVPVCAWNFIYHPERRTQIKDFRKWVAEGGVFSKGVEET